MADKILSAFLILFVQCMKKDFWNERYSIEEFIYGTKPNEFLAEQLRELKPGKALFVAEGEGRNAIYAATKGWQVEAFDYSEEGKKKAEYLAQNHQVNIDYKVTTYDDFEPKNAPFDAIVLIFNHTDSLTRKAFNAKLKDWLKPGGFIIMEQFSKNQIGLDSGGPKSEDFLLDLASAKEEFSDFIIDYLSEEQTVLDEGKYHSGKAYVLRMLAHKES
jgi:2-polyprenyl-3-methyl-5-hydroxy-6-metoxy-1,4-benzoquinol methylase